jgi:hypothetical protein
MHIVNSFTLNLAPRRSSPKGRRLLLTLGCQGRDVVTKGILGHIEIGTKKVY